MCSIFHGGLSIWRTQAPISAAGSRLGVVPGTQPWARIDLFDDPPWQDDAENGQPGINTRSWMAFAAVALGVVWVLVLVTVFGLFPHAFAHFPPIRP
jgi:hypothetical protein